MGGPAHGRALKHCFENWLILMQNITNDIVCMWEMPFCRYVHCVHRVVVTVMLDH